ncbi:MAG: undecaprenyl-diphosphate phosphatase [Candidatus Omnitrophica bacterium]|nr:undecaprenyl-diphosphate phosphatase [Candidatus Omnitrophota bacterium]
MTLLEAASAGALQGITEFLPISSSGHLVLLHQCFGFKEPKLLFDLFLHLGTVASVLILFRKKIFLSFTKERTLFRFVLLGTLPTVVIGLVLGKTLESFFTQPRIVGWGFLISAAWLFLGQRFRHPQGKGLSVGKALLIGASQGIAIVPGISRSGATIATGLLLGLEGSLAVQYSFLLSIPAIGGAFFYKVFLSKTEEPVALPSFLGEEGRAMLAGTLLAFVVGLFAIRVIMRLVSKNKLYFFSLYLTLLGLLTLVIFRGKP